MTRTYTRFTRLLMASAVFLLTLEFAWATSFKPLSLEELCARSDVIVEANVLSSKAVATSEDFDRLLDIRIEPPEGLTLTPQQRQTYHIHTVSRILVTRVIYGPVAKGTILSLRSPGGQVGDDFSFLDGTPKLRPAMKVLLFLQKGPGAHYVIVGLAQGCFHLHHDPQTLRAYVVPEVVGAGWPRHAVQEAENRELQPALTPPVGQDAFDTDAFITDVSEIVSTRER